MRKLIIAAILPFFFFTCDFFNLDFDNPLDPASADFIGEDGVIAPVTGLSIDEEGDSLDLSWNNTSYPNDSGRYFTIFIYRSERSAPVWGDSDSFLETTTSNSYSDSKALADTVYFYSLFAGLEDGSHYSAATSISGKLGGSVAREGLVAEFLFDGDADDSSGNENNGTVNGATLISDRFGKAKKAYLFDGVDDWILIADPVPGTLKIENEITLSAWIQVENILDLGLIVGSQTDVSTSGASLFVDNRVNSDGQTSPAGHIHFQIGNGSWHASNTNSKVPLSKWVLITAVRSANSGARIYYNTDLQESYSADWDGSVSYDESMIAIGKQIDKLRHFNGKIDDVRIYDKALSEDEIKNIYYDGGWTGTQTAFAVTYIANGADSGSVPEDSISYGTDKKVTILGNTGTLVKEGYRFDGWNTKADGSGTTYKADDTFYMSSTDVTLYALWTKVYTVTYDANGGDSGSVPVDPGLYAKGESVKVLDNSGSLAKSGYIFEGWNTQADGSGLIYVKDNSITMEEKNIILYAVWALKSSTASSDPDIPTSGLMAEYLFNGNTKDTSGHGYNGTNKGAALTTDRFGTADKAYIFDGSNDSIELSDWDYKTMSVSLWVNPTGNYSDERMIFGDETSDGYFSFRVMLRKTSGNLHYSHYTDTLKGSELSSGLTSHYWTHLVILRDYSASQYKLYINGTLKETVSFKGNSFTDIANNFMLGYCDYPSGHPFSGKLDDVRVYNKLLTEDQISAIYDENDYISEVKSIVMKDVLPASATPKTASLQGGTDNVTLTRSFKMSQTEITQKQYANVMGRSESWSTTYGKGDNYPAYYVDWYEAAQFCNELSEDDGKTKCYYSDAAFTDPYEASDTNTIYWKTDANGYRLPTESEWEYAAQGGNGSSYTYAGSNTIDEVAWYYDNSGNKAQVVKQKAGNAYGLYDMSGNLLEMSWDWSGAYSGGTDPSGPNSGLYKILRGGSFGHNSAASTIENRGHSIYPNDGTLYSVGFRIVCTP